MQVIIVGGGIIGVCTAYHLRRHGAEVTVIDREPDVARATSLGNAGVIAPGYVTPWAAPGMPTKILKYLFRSESPVIYRPVADTRQWRWVSRWLRECELPRYRVNKERMQRIAYYSKACLTEFRSEHAFEYWRSQGYLQLFRTAFDEEMARPAMQILAEAGITHRLLDAEGCAEIEPALKGAALRPASGLYLPDDESGDCAVFAQQLRTVCEENGVRFRFNTRVRSLAGSRSGVEGVRISDAALPSTELLKADTIIVAAGIESRDLLAPLGVDVPIYPVKGYSATIAVTDPDKALRGAVMDEALKTSITRMGPNIRVAGTAELGDSALTIRDKATRTLMKVLQDWFPGAVQPETARYWVGLRPMTPDGPPLMGATPVPGLYINLGHGSTGWAMSMGSGRVVADLATGQQPEIDLSGLTLERYAG
ncbi:D-amino acid dehydrogenase [Candidimonas humi]|jgi:D-amino-acid dehydrogenase|uniref:D-amino acid dehydrogenase n=1 Tax=Candidimonas humi TaxID=683355 RepID=A0ABV8NW86_9BURK|nr:D-amino acid dehydrogenase [Candidimonas humi]